ncbi:MAG: hypothetical protein HY553_11845 [Elusimicrobia bacterium]|nr:hypothetical protein [Elusimicrobiota bacterium]
MARQRSPVALLAGIVALYAAGLGLVAAGRAWRRPVVLETSRPAFFHDEFVEIRLRTRDGDLRRRLEEAPPRVVVLRDGAAVPTIAGLTRVGLEWSDEDRAFAARWPCPWNAAPGAYELALEGGPELDDRLTVKGFEIRRRVPKALPPGFAALTLEAQQPLASLRVVAPDGVEKGWTGLLDWVQYMEADAFWMLVGDTPGSGPGELWRAENFDLVPAVAEECKRRGLAFGVYAMSYLTTSRERLPRYEYAWDVESGRAKITRAISLRDPQRPKDVAALLRRFAAVPGVDYVGLDYIRNALGGYELIDDFFAEMPGVRPPPGWEGLSREERMVWFHRKKVMRKDLAFVDAWQWWRAHRVGRIVREIRAAVPDEVLWAFTLTWDKGWNHGQDVVMMNDAGVDADALMLYEADSKQFEHILRSFNAYVGRHDAQLMVGDVVDWPLHQRRGPKELRRRLAAAIDRVYGDGEPPAGLFVHDVGRALWGRLGPYTTRQWMDAARDAVRQLKARRRLT